MRIWMCMAGIVPGRRARRQWQEWQPSIDSGQMTPRVVALALEPVIVLDLAAPAHVFGHLGGSRYSFAVAAVTPPAIRTTTSFALATEHGLEALERADTVVVPGYDGIDVPPPAAALDALRAAHARGAR